MTFNPERALDCLREINANLADGSITPQEAIEQFSARGLELVPVEVTIFMINGVRVEHPYNISSQSDITWTMSDIEARLIYLCKLNI